MDEDLRKYWNEEEQSHVHEFLGSTRLAELKVRVDSGGRSFFVNFLQPHPVRCRSLFQSVESIIPLVSVLLT